MRVRRHKTIPLAILVTVIACATVSAAEPRDFPDTRPLSAWQSFDPSAYGDECLLLDRDEDGVPDYAVQINDRGYKLREAVDFNGDGLMDDFYFYENDVLQRQEIDSNFDQRIDIWIHLRRGVYISMWERDRDYDGVIDSRETYGGEHE